MLHSLVDLRLRLADLNDAITDLERQLALDPKSTLLQDCHTAYSRKAASLEVIINRRTKGVADGQP